MTTPLIRRFGAGVAEGGAEEAALLGGKGAHLCEMAAMGLPAPPGFVITIEAYRAWLENRRRLPDALFDEIRDALSWLESVTERSFGAAARPLLVAVRSGAPVSMPGMMDTVLNVGLTEEALGALAEEITPRFAQDCRRRLIPMLAGTALDVDPELMEETLEDWLHERGHDDLEGLDSGALGDVNAALLRAVEEEAGEPFPDDAEDQLRLSLNAVFRSWNSRRARNYRAMHGIDDDIGSAAVVQAMVFGNRREGAASGVAFTRDPNTGEARLYGEYLENAQGEEIVAGLRTPAPLTLADAEATGARAEPLETRMPEAFAELKDACARLERRYADAQDVEFTIQDGRLWLLQTRTAKRSAKAAIRIAVEMAEAGWITRDEALLRFNPTDIDRILHPMVDADAPRDIVARGLPASPGAVTGEVVFTPEEAETLNAKGRDAILIRVETSPEDIHGMYAAAGVLTVRGGMTSHAAVVARGLGKPCVCGARDASVDLKARILIASDGREIRTGDILTIDGALGEALMGAAPMIEPTPDIAFSMLMDWADARRRLKVRANADTAQDARIARRLGAEGVGLCRTEHAFFQPGRLVALREMILAADPTARRQALSRLLPLQREDFEALFTEMKGLPVCIRLLDPPLHEFLPRSEDEVAAVAQAMEISTHEVEARAEALREFNPMLGRRGCRVGIMFPEIYDMQARAILQAAANIEIDLGAPVDLEIMIPFVSSEREMRLLSGRIEAMAGAVRHQAGACPAYRIGAMIESPRSALRAAQLCETAQFISLGTNDMTQMVFGLSRDDAGRFMRDYVGHGALAYDPFHKLDEEGVGEMLSIAVERGRSARKDLLVGLCGEHGGDPATVRFCELLKLDYVSCSPFRTPATRLAAAQATILEGGDG